MQRSLSSFKYHGRREYAKFYASGIFKEFHGMLSDIRPDILVPVPVHEERLRNRGYNQAHLIAAELSFLSGIPVAPDLLIRCKKTTAQKELGPDMRRKNLSGAFAINDRSLWYNKYIRTALLVDDIYTTGSTADICASVLKSCGIRHVYVVCVAGVQADI